MESKNLVAKAETRINCNIDKVWDAFVNPQTIKKYMFGTTVVSDFKEGSKIIWKGEWKGKPYEDKGQILQLKPKEKLQYNHYSPMMGLPDVPENYHTVTVELSNEGNQTQVRLTQDKNANEEARQHSEQNWKMMLDGLKKLLEKEDVVKKS